ncbi:cupin domain-containing protein [Ruegeria sp. EL01]|jgi:mannose-6-phosphate isomerase-like protein (cupin superfamily)|uniref:cupin domain-containing protein n=1 Tax=Ruegeria sp. EL01 TaxID=2107578 RepID=UPI000EA80D95|nr:cupin domain-containing protein [Ruegeria sp. EL01]
MSHTTLDFLPEPSGPDSENTSSPWATHRDDAPIEGGFDAKYGDVMWQTLICGDRMQSTDLVLGIAHIPAFGSLPLHSHDPAEFYFVVSGYAEVSIDGKIATVGSGMAIFIPGGAIHGITAGAEGIEFIYGFPESRFGDVIYNFSQQQGVEQ